MIAVLVGVGVAGIATGGILPSLEGLWLLQRHPARLLSDFTSIAGDGGAFLNASLVASLGLCLVKLARVRVSGPTVAALFTMLGFGLFGKTVLNVLPILAGVALAARIAGKKLGDYILIALFGTAIAPLVPLLAVEVGLPGPAGIAIATACGVGAGMLLPAAAVVMLRLHQGYSLYNVGLTTGFLALFAASLVLVRVPALASAVVWNDQPSLLRSWLVPALSVLLIVGGFAHGPRETARAYLRLLRLPGWLPSDFVDSVSPGAALLNMGVLGAAAWAYVVAVGGDLSGPVVGGILTVMGFAAFGKHPRNCWPVLAGVVLAAVAGGRELAAPTVILAALFATTLAPLAGEFGVVAGLVAGFLHLTIVERSASWHAGIGLYNNGFAGGLTAALIVAVIEWYRTNRVRGGQGKDRR